MRKRYEAVEADFQRFYGLDLGEMWTGGMGPRRAARLASQLPPGAAIYRPDGLDSQIYSLEAQLLRVLVNMQIERKADRIPTADEELAKAEKIERVKQRRQQAISAALAQRLGQVSNG